MAYPKVSKKNKNKNRTDTEYKRKLEENIEVESGNFFEKHI